MPPRLHPRSTLTSSLFATTLLASFLVVGIPHLVPCPAPRVAYADGEMPVDGSQRRRRRRRKCLNTDGSPQESCKDTNQLDGGSTDEEESLAHQLREASSKRECPVPKPNGILGSILGFKNDSTVVKEGKESSRPPWRRCNTTLYIFTKKIPKCCSKKNWYRVLPLDSLQRSLLQMMLHTMKTSLWAGLNAQINISAALKPFERYPLARKLRLVFYPLTLHLVLFLPLPYRLSRCERDIFCEYTHSLLYIPVLVLVEDLLCFFREPVNFASKSFAHQFCMCYAFVSASSDHGVKFSFTTTQIEPRAQIEHIAIINSVSGWS